jgi:hypothetical protein
VRLCARASSHCVERSKNAITCQSAKRAPVSGLPCLTGGCIRYHPEVTSCAVTVRGGLFGAESPKLCCCEAHPQTATASANIVTDIMEISRFMNWFYSASDSVAKRTTLLILLGKHVKLKFPRCDFAEHR